MRALSAGVTLIFIIFIFDDAIGELSVFLHVKDINPNTSLFSAFPAPKLKDFATDPLHSTDAPTFWERRRTSTRLHHPSLTATGWDIQSLWAKNIARNGGEELGKFVPKYRSFQYRKCLGVLRDSSQKGEYDREIRIES